VETIMTDTPTPGQLAYESWWRAFGDAPPLIDAYTALTPRAQQAWEAAAQAVLGARHAFRFAVGHIVTWDDAPGALWQIIERRQHEGVTTIWRTYDLLPAAGDLTDFRPLSVAEVHLEAVEEDTA
jgi:hypothetical protein